MEDLDLLVLPSSESKSGDGKGVFGEDAGVEILVRSCATASLESVEKLEKHRL
jgi:hypothetical protein